MHVSIKLAQVSLVAMQVSTGLVVFYLSSLIGSWGISWAEPEREFPQCFLCQVVAEVIKEGYDVIIRLQSVRPADRERCRCYFR